LLLIDSRILDDEASEVVKSIGNFFAFFGAGFSSEKRFNIDDGDFEIGELI
jgi:hypothetical protein